MTEEEQGDDGDEQHDGASLLRQPALVVTREPLQRDMEEYPAMENGQDQQGDDIDTDGIEEVVELKREIPRGVRGALPLGDIWCLARGETARASETSY